MKVQGKVEHKDLEGGIWQLVADSGQRYTLASAPPDLKKCAGERVEIDGAVEEGGGFGFAMSGSILKVRSFKKL